MDDNSYQASLSGAAYYLQEEAGFVRAKGPDRIDFIQRQTTGDVRQLKPERAVLSVLTSPTARILDVLYLIGSPAGQEGHIDMITLPGKSQQTATYLKSRIFFNDNVSILDMSNSYVQIDLMGPQAANIIRSWVSSGGMEANAILQSQVEGFSILALRQDNQFGLGWRLILLKEARDAILSKLDKEKAVELADEVYEIRRIEEGNPAVAKELTDAYTPLEVNLKEAVSDNKGCYTGQEVIARQITYDKVTRRLVGLNLERRVSPGAEIRVEGRIAGSVTSAAHSPRFGPVALGIIKRPFFEPETQVMVMDEGDQIPASTKALPFL
jgi:tRNA-modifying protein YgfZ